MDILKLIKYSIQTLYKGTIVAVATFLTTFIGYSAVLQMGAKTPNHATFLDSSNSIFFFLVITILISILIGQLFIILKQRFIERLISIFLYHFFFNHLFRIGDIFFTNTKTGFTYEMLFHIIPSIVFALLITILWKPKGELTSVFEKVEEYIKFRETKSWVARFLIGWLSFIPIYYFTAWLISPFIEPYYPELTSEVANRSLSFSITIFIKIGISTLFVTVLMPIFVLWQRSKTSLLFWVGFPIFVQGAVYSSLIEHWLPIGMRFPYLIQYTVVAYLMAIIFVQLFFVPSENEIIDDQFKWIY